MTRLWMVWVLETMLGPRLNVCTIRYTDSFWRLESPKSSMVTHLVIYGSV